MDGEELIASVLHKIEREKALITAASNMRQSTDNPLVQQRVDANIREGRKNIAYLEEKMRELEIRQRNQGAGSPGQRGGPLLHPKTTLDMAANKATTANRTILREAQARCLPVPHSPTLDLTPRSRRLGPITQS
ncbi:uncharacterized protein N7506_010398 [Penicillium brevicompactum]|uniref:uncharacterized protein n=1 Tax=Penicillium brevicompactum TaxID=5074 RepID=UPI0025413B03|nr:uncharacterized protein N7506_010398 [Penicillium brevicompactum]KAJ5327296.1 hypothetical protein N7506_010398 [Penicillium brevicompactum]